MTTQNFIVCILSHNCCPIPEHCLFPIFSCIFSYTNISVQQFSFSSLIMSIEKNSRCEITQQKSMSCSLRFWIFIANLLSRKGRNSLHTYHYMSGSIIEILNIIFVCNMKKSYQKGPISSIWRRQHSNSQIQNTELNIRKSLWGNEKMNRKMNRKEKMNRKRTFC